MNHPEHYTLDTTRVWQKWSVVIRSVPVLAVVAMLKYLAYYYGYEVMELNALFSSVVAGTIFLIGFLISGVLADYKESERLPSELAASINILFDDASCMRSGQSAEAARRFMEYQRDFCRILVEWFHRRARTKDLLERVSRMSEMFTALERDGVHPAYLTKMKAEQGALRRLLLRIDTVRDTTFVGSAYTIVEVMGVIVTAGMILTRIPPFYTSLFFTVIVSFLILYMLVLIRDLDNPFDYAGKGERGTEVSLKPLHDLQIVLDNADRAERVV
jgi:hypothetical protein